MVMADLVAYLKRRGIKGINKFKVYYAIEMGYVQKPLKDGAGNYEFSAYIKQYEEFFMAQQEKRSAR